MHKSWFWKSICGKAVSKIVLWPVFEAWWFSSHMYNVFIGNDPTFQRRTDNMIHCQLPSTLNKTGLGAAIMFILLTLNCFDLYSDQKLFQWY